jgi:apolipoprotein N-acyltransferase
MNRQYTALRVALAIVSGFALGLAFPKFDFNLLAWAAFVPLLYAADGQSLRAVFGLGWLQGMARHALSLYWIEITLHTFAGVNPMIAILPMLLLAALLAIFSAVAFFASEFCSRRLRIPLFVTLPIAWAAVEWVQSFFPIGFPWNLVGYSAYRNLELIQFAEFTGVYGVSALILFFNAVVFTILFTRASRSAQMASLVSLTALMVAATVFGSLRIRQLESAAPAGKLRVAMVQGDIPQSIKWDPKFLESSFRVYANQTEMAAKRGVDLTIWPEAAAAFFFQPEDRYPPDFSVDESYRTALLTLARTTGVPILFGAPALQARDGQVGFTNRAYLVSGQGTVVAWYDKIQLVPFGEYVPLHAILGGLVNKIVKGFGDMIPGEVQTIFTVKGARLGVLICYESVFPDLTRRAADAGAEILVNITNDAWYGTSSAPYQLLAMATMRSVETKLPMIRVANTGISAIIGPTGGIIAPTPLFQRGTEIEDVSYRDRATVYTRVGDLFSEICFVLTVAALIIGWRRPRRLSPLDEHVATLLASNGRG